MKLKQLVLLLVFGYSMWTSPVSANADEFIEWAGKVEVGYSMLYVGINKYSGDVIYLSRGGNGVSLQVIPHSLIK
jgi:hypothetical protein